jgi:hypothetical protein
MNLDLQVAESLAIGHRICGKYVVRRSILIVSVTAWSQRQKFDAAWMPAKGSGNEQQLLATVFNHV